MNTKSIIPIRIILLAFILGGLLAACKRVDRDPHPIEPYETYVIASRRSYMSLGESFCKVYLVRKSNDTEWQSDVRWLEGLDYEDGTEYQVIAAKAEKTIMICYSETTLKGMIVKEVLSKTKKESDGLPEGIWYWDPSWSEDYNPFFASNN